MSFNPLRAPTPNYFVCLSIGVGRARRSPPPGTGGTEPGGGPGRGGKGGGGPYSPLPAPGCVPRAPRGAAGAGADTCARYIKRRSSWRGAKGESGANAFLADRWQACTLGGAGEGRAGGRCFVTFPAFYLFVY